MSAAVFGLAADRARAQGLLAQLRAQGVSIDAATELSADSRAIDRDAVFLAYPGTHADGRRYIGAAISAGARAVLWEKNGFDWDSIWRLPNVPVAELRTLAGPIASEIYGHPSERLWIIGVTGTNGKTSVSQWIAQALARLGRPCTVIGTLGIGLMNDTVDTILTPNPNTTPDAIVLQRTLAESVRAGARAVAMEVSSIGLEQGRVNGTAFDVAVLTNLSRDHLDYHGSMERYAEAKARLFDWEGLDAIVLNLDDELGARIARSVASRGVACIGYSTEARQSSATFRADNIRHTATGLAFRLRGPFGEKDVSTGLTGSFNVSNLLAVIGALYASGIALDDMLRIIATLTPVPGRMQRVGGRGGRPTVIVDYAHTPDALEKVLDAAHAMASERSGRLIAVFGCGGDRDRGKRPLMGEVASRLADRVVITSDNPRSENPQAIIDEIMGGASRATDEHRVIVDRAEAIRSAIASAASNDVVVIAGKGHETYQEIAGKRYPFSDVAEAEAALA